MKSIKSVASFNQGLYVQIWVFLLKSLCFFPCSI